MPFDGNRWNYSKFVPYRKMLAEVMAQWPDLERLTDGANDTSKASQELHTQGAFNRGSFYSYFILKSCPTRGVYSGEAFIRGRRLFLV